MIINPSTPINLGARQRPATSNPKRLLTWGESPSGDVLVYDTAVTEYPIPLYFKKVSAANMLSLQTFLNENNGKDISVTLDSGDDLGCGLSGTVSLLYIPNSFSAEYRYGTTWAVSFTLRYRVA